MKALITLSILILSTNLACTAYQSDAHEFIQTKGKYENNKVVINATDSFEESFCIANNPEFKEFVSTNKHIIKGSQPELKTNFDVYKNSNETKAKVNYTNEALTYTCLFHLKKPDFSMENIEFLVDEGLHSLLDARD